MKQFRVVGENWAGLDVQLATTFIDNWRGIGAVPRGVGLLMRRRAIHTIGLGYALHGVGVDSAGTVISVKTMAPNRFFYFPHSAYVIEVPVSVHPPSPGTSIRLIE